MGDGILSAFAVRAILRHLDLAMYDNRLQGIDRDQESLSTWHIRQAREWLTDAASGGADLAVEALGREAVR